MRKRLHNQKGLTLIEILAAIALLGIVLFIFMSIFTQSAKFSAHNQETLTAVQIAEQVVADVRGLEEIAALKGVKNYKLITDYIEDKKTYERFVIKITEEPVSISGSLVLKKAKISVKAKPGVIVKDPEFSTEMYLKVQP